MNLLQVYFSIKKNNGHEPDLHRDLGRRALMHEKKIQNESVMLHGKSLSSHNIAFVKG